MKILKRFLIVLVCVALIYFPGVYFGFFNAGFFGSTSSIDSFRAIPKNAAIILSVNDLPGICKQAAKQSYFSDIMTLGYLKKFESGYKVIDSLFYPDMQSDTGNRYPLIASLHLISARDFDFLFLIKDDKHCKSEFNNIQEIISNNQIKAEKRLFEKVSIYEISIHEGQTFTCAYTNNIFIGSFTAFLIEDAILQLNDPNTSDISHYFQKWQHSNDKERELLIHINLHNFSGLIKAFVNQKSRPIFDALSFFTGWLQIDVELNDNSINFNGYGISQDSGMHYLESLQGQQRGDFDLLRYCPDNTAYMLYKGISSVKSYLESVRDSTYIDEKTIPYLLPWVGNEWAYLGLEAHDLNYHDGEVAIVAAKDTTIAKKSLFKFAGIENEMSINAGHVYQSKKIYRITETGLLNGLIPKAINNLNLPYFTILDQYVLFCNSLNQLKLVLNKYQNNQTLEKQVRYNAFSEQMASSANVYFYMNPERMFNILMAVCHDNIKIAIEDEFHVYKKLSPCGIQFSVEEDFSLVNGSIAYTSNKTFKPEILWETELDTHFISGPQIVFNHQKQSEEVLIQDVANTLYLISSAGNVVWRKQLDGYIRGKVYQIDYYDNKKLQFLFGTTNRIYLVDINGKNVSHFPIKLSSAASNNLFVIDYDNNKKYRMFIACNGERIYGFEKSGKPLPNWNPKSKQGKVHLPILHFSERSKDFLVSCNTKGDIRFFNRAGNLRIPKLELNTSFSNPFFVSKDTFPYHIVNSDTNGIIYSIATDGNVNQKELGNWTSEHVFGAYNISGNQQLEYIFFDKNRLSAYLNNGSLFFEHFFPDIENGEITFVQIDGDEKYQVGVVDKSGQQVYLYNENGSLLDGFPVKGGSTFEVSYLYKDKGKVLVVGVDSSMVRAYLIE